MKGHYFHQDLYIAKKIFKNNPKKHADIGSRVDGFVAHVASFREIEIFDIRPLNSMVKNIKYIQADLSDENFLIVEHYDSVSCLHALEHFGLGRYGDLVDIYGHIKGLENIYKMLKKGGKFYFSAPIGKQRVEFNAHRIFGLAYLMNIFAEKYVLDSFSFVNDQGDLIENFKLTETDIRDNLVLIFGCGIFELTKK